MFTDKSRQYPNLVQYLNAAVRRSEAPNALEAQAMFSTIALASAAVITKALFPAVGWIAILLLLGGAMVAGWAYFRLKTQREADPEARQRREARGVAQSLHTMIQHRRLHRDVDAASLTVLEECARHWARARSALGSGFWSSPDLPAHYRSARETALRAVEGAMEEVMILYRDYVPEQVPGRPAMDYVEEALEQFAIKPPRDVPFVPVALEPARQIAEKLRTLANEAERISLEAHDAVPQTVPGSALDMSLGELRTIRQAEEELHQNLGG